MKKKILSTAFAVVIMAVAGYNVYLSQTKSDLSELALANVEALANIDYGTSGIKGYCNQSYIIITECQVFCFVCKNTWYPETRIPKATAYDVSGSCRCGNTNWGYYNE